MPGRDGTGPLGAGPMTGRAMGNCAIAAGPGYADVAPGRGFAGRGFARGGGRGGRGGRNNCRAAGAPGWMRFVTGFQAGPETLSSDGELGALQRQAAIIQKQLDAIGKRIDVLVSAKDSGTV